MQGGIQPAPPTEERLPSQPRPFPPRESSSVGTRPCLYFGSANLLNPRPPTLNRPPPAYRTHSSGSTTNFIIESGTQLSRLMESPGDQTRRRGNGKMATLEESESSQPKRGARDGVGAARGGFGPASRSEMMNCTACVCMRVIDILRLAVIQSHSFLNGCFTRKSHSFITISVARISTKICISRAYFAR